MVAESQSKRIPLAEIRVLSNPRKVYDSGKLEELIGSLKANGQIQDVVVQRAAEGYELIVGTRRYKAFQELQKRFPDDARWVAISASVREIDPALIPAIQLAENDSRDDLDPIELAEAIAEAKRAKGKTEQEIAAALGWSTKRTVQQYVSLADAPEFLKTWSSGFTYPVRKTDKEGTPILDPKTNKAAITYERAEKFTATAYFEFDKFYRKIHKWDQRQLALDSKHRVRAEAETTKLAEQFARDGWSIAMLRTRADASAKKLTTRDAEESAALPAKPRLAVDVTGDRLVIDRSKLKEPMSYEELVDLKEKVADFLVAIGFGSISIEVPKPEALAAE